MITDMATFATPSPLVQSVIAWLDGLLFSFIPITVIVVLNVAIVAKMVRIQHFRTDHSNEKEMTATQIALFRTTLTVTTAFIIFTLPISCMTIYFGVLTTQESEITDLLSAASV